MFRTVLATYLDLPELIQVLPCRDATLPSDMTFKFRSVLNWRLEKVAEVVDTDPDVFSRFETRSRRCRHERAARHP